VSFSQESTHVTSSYSYNKKAALWRFITVTKTDLILFYFVFPRQEFLEHDTRTVFILCATIQCWVLKNRGSRFQPRLPASQRTWPRSHGATVAHNSSAEKMLPYHLRSIKSYHMVNYKLFCYYDKGTFKYHMTIRGERGAKPSGCCHMGEEVG